MDDPAGTLLEFKASLGQPWLQRETVFQNRTTKERHYITSGVVVRRYDLSILGEVGAGLGV